MPWVGWAVAGRQTSEASNALPIIIKRVFMFLSFVVLCLFILGIYRREYSGICK
jgi:hypothetical protein